MSQRAAGAQAPPAPDPAPDSGSPDTASGPRRHLGYQPALDGIRALAILGVIALHSSGWGAVPHVLPGGHLGVTVFFVLSGYLITTLLLAERARTGTINLRHFYLRRAARLLPGLLIVLVVHTLFWWPRINHWTLITTALAVVFYLSSIMQGFWSDMTAISWSWSLSVEEHFYFLWPPLLLWLLATRRVRHRVVGLLRRHPHQVAAAVAVAIIGISTGLRIAFVHSQRWHDFLYFSTFTRMDELAVGCLVALFLWHYRLPLARVLGWVGLAVLGFCYADPNLDIGKPELSLWGLPVAAAAAALLVGSVVHQPRSLLARLLSLRPLVHIGVVSYGLYLWNLLPGVALKAVAGHDLGPLGTIWALVLAVIAVELSYRFVERPIMVWAKARMRGERRPLWSHVQQPSGVPAVTELGMPTSTTATESTRAAVARTGTVPAVIR